VRGFRYGLAKSKHSNLLVVVPAFPAGARETTTGGIPLFRSKLLRSDGGTNAIDTAPLEWTANLRHPDK